MNEDLRKCLESIQNSIAEIKTMGNITIGDIYAAKNTYELSNEEVRLIFSI